MDSSTLQKTPLFSCHVELEARIVPFGGWAMPVSYRSVLEEHRAVRSHCGIFDVSHMGEVRVRGKGARDFLQYVTINDTEKLVDGGGQYSAMLTESGGMVDDLILYRLTEDDFLICINASNRAKDFEWLRKKSMGKKNLEVLDESEQWGQIAIQGPKSLECLLQVLDRSVHAAINQLPYTHILKTDFAGQSIFVARTGYTGERGFEIYLPTDVTAEFWKKALATSPEVRPTPCGLGARDTLRLEACYLLYGNDMDETVNPLEAGIGWATKLHKEFCGKEALLRAKEQGLSRSLFAFQMVDQGIPRSGMPVENLSGKPIGKVTSGSVLPTVGGAGGLAMINEPHLVEIGSQILIDIRGKKVLARLAKKPLYSAKVK